MPRVSRAADFKVKVRTGRFASRADATDQLALTHGRALGRDDGAHVRIEGLGAVRMLDDHVISVAAVPCAVLLGNDDDAVCGRIDRRAFGRADVNGVPSVQTLRDDTVDREGEISGDRGARTAQVRLADGAAFTAAG